MILSSLSRLGKPQPCLTIPATVIKKRFRLPLSGMADRMGAVHTFALADIYPTALAVMQVPFLLPCAILAPKYNMRRYRQAAPYRPGRPFPFAASPYNNRQGA